MRTTLAAVAVAFLVAGGFAGTARAQCAWTAYGWSCSSYRYSGYGVDDPAFGYYRGRGNVPYAAYGAASHMGPDPGGGFRHMGQEHGAVD